MKNNNIKKFTPKKKENTEKEKFNPIILKFTTEDFNDGMQSLRDVCDDEISYLFEDGNGYYASDSIARQNFVKWFSDHIPVFKNRETQFNSLSCSYNKINMKFTGYFSIGWVSFVDKDTNMIKYTFFYTIESERIKNKVYDYLTSNGWVEDKKE